MSENSRLVYSTDNNNICTKCKNTFRKCTCLKEQSELDPEAALHIYFEKKGRKGSGVTVISGLPLKNKEVKNLATNLKKLCGVGGSVKSNNSIELQGEQKTKIQAYFSKHEIFKNL